MVQYLILAIGFVKGLLVAKYLGPALLGSYGLIVLILDYTKYSNLGIFSAMNLEVSVNLGKLDKEKYINDVITASVTYLFALGILFALVAFIVGSFFPFLVADDVKKYLYAVFFIAFVGQWKDFVVIHFRLYEKYHMINWVELVSNVILVVLVVLFVADYKLDAVLAAMVISSLSILIFSVSILFHKIKFRVDWHILKGLIVVGFPILIYAMCEKVYMTIDRIMIVNFLTRKDLGYFTLSSSILSSTVIFLGAFSFLYYPKFLKKFNRLDTSVESGKQLFTDIKRYSCLYSALSLALGVTGIVLIDPFVHFFLPQYESSIFVYRILILGVLFDQISYFAATYLISNKHQISLIVVICVGAILSVFLNFLFLGLNSGLTGIAVATALSFAFYALAKFYIVLRKIHCFSWRNLFAIYKNFFVMTAFLIPLIMWLPQYLFLSIPLLFLLHRHEFVAVMKQLNFFPLASVRS